MPLGRRRFFGVRIQNVTPWLATEITSLVWG
jgi:hypothetical protein